MRKLIKLFIVAILFSLWGTWVVSVAYPQEYIVDSEDAIIKYETLSTDWLEWKPQLDITTYELAKCIEIIFLGQHTTDIFSLWEDAPLTVKRHFVYHKD